MRCHRVARGTSVVVLAVLVLVSTVWSQQVHRNGFEAPRTQWHKSSTDAGFVEVLHETTDQGAHDGKRCEHLKLDVKSGTFIHYQYAVGKAPVTDELSTHLYVKANRPNLQFVARVVLPNERDPNNLSQRLTTLLRGDVYRNTGRWQRLEIGRPVQLLKQQQQLMQAQYRQSINISDAYVDALLINVCGGPGATEVWLDDLEIGPLLSGPPAATDTRQPAETRPSAEARPGESREPANTAAKTTSITRPTTRAGTVEFNGTQLVVGGKRFFFRGIRYTDTPLRTLRDAGFNTLIVDQAASPQALREAADLGFWLAPTLKLAGADAATSAAAVSRDLARFSESDAVLFHHLGGMLSYEQAPVVARAAQLVKNADPGRPVAADVWDGLQPYSRSLQLVGIHRWPLMTSLELAKYREWLNQRRLLANAGTFVWTWVQTHMPDWYTYLLYNQPGHEAFKELVGPQSEQVRLLAYTAVAAGCRGLAFWSDRFLADSHHGRDRLLTAALVNQELDMLESLLVSIDYDPEWIEAQTPEGKPVRDVKAVVLRTGKNKEIVVLPMWQGPGAQFVPGQAAVAKLTLTIPQVPVGHQVWEVTPGEVRALRPDRVTGGSRVTIPEFGLTTALVFTGDTNQIIRFQDQCRSRRQLAAQWTYDEAVYAWEKLKKIEAQLSSLGRNLPDGMQLMHDAQTRLQTARQMWDNRLFSEAYREAQRAQRPMRIVMRAQWDEAVKQLDSPVSSPYAVSYYTLPRHWEFMEQVQKSTPLPNRLAGGDFESTPQGQDAWRPEELTFDDVVMTAQRTGLVDRPIRPVSSGNVPTLVDSPQEGKQCLMLQIQPKTKAQRPEALERTLLAMHGPVVKLEPGSLVRISAWVRIPTPLTASVDGALFYDSAGGEPLAIRLTEPTPWRKLTLYRKVPPSGALHVTLALTGLGTVYFDDVRIEPLVPSANIVGPAGLLGPPR